MGTKKTRLRVSQSLQDKWWIVSTLLKPSAVNKGHVPVHLSPFICHWSDRWVSNSHSRLCVKTTFAWRLLGYCSEMDARRWMLMPPPPHTHTHYPYRIANKPNSTKCQCVCSQTETEWYLTHLSWPSTTPNHNCKQLPQSPWIIWPSPQATTVVLSRHKTRPRGSNAKKQSANPHQNSGWIPASCWGSAYIT